MRKADYSILAEIIRSRLNPSNGGPTSAPRAMRDMDRDMNAGAHTAVRNLALSFAARASVDRTEFLKACGIEP